MIDGKKRYLFAVSIVVGALVSALADAADSADSLPLYVVKSIDDSVRMPDSVAYDVIRRPAAVMTFTTVKPGDVVVDLAPEQGYYTKILSRIVGSRGIVYPMVPKYGAPVLPTARTDSPQITAERAPAAAALAPVLAIANVSSYSNVRPMSVNIDQYGGNVPLPEQADVVFMVNGYHDMHGNRYSVPSNTKPLDMLAVNKAIFDAVNSGGVYVIIDNAAAKGTGFTVAQSLSRADKEAVKAEVIAAGFVFEAESTVLANPADDHSKPATDPSLGGKPDQFMLRFRKPLNSPLPKRRSDEVMSSLYGNTIVYWNFCMTALDGRRPICGLKDTEHHLRYLADHTFQVNGLPGDDPLIMGTWFWDARGYVCQWGEMPQRGGVMCHVPNIGRKVNEKWNAFPYGTSQVMKTRLAPGFLREFGTFTEADFPLDENR